MLNNMDYLIIRCDTLDELCEEVNTRIKEGYVPVGGVESIHYLNFCGNGKDGDSDYDMSEDHEFCQAVCKRHIIS